MSAARRGVEVLRYGAGKLGEVRVDVQFAEGAHGASGTPRRPNAGSTKPPRRRVGAAPGASSGPREGEHVIARSLGLARRPRHRVLRRYCRRRARRACRTRCTAGRPPHTPPGCPRDWRRVPAPRAPCRCPCRYARKRAVGPRPDEDQTAGGHHQAVARRMIAAGVVDPFRGERRDHAERDLPLRSPPFRSYAVSSDHGGATRATHCWR